VDGDHAAAKRVGFHLFPNVSREAAAGVGHFGFHHDACRRFAAIQESIDFQFPGLRGLLVRM
jgi:hypothetical protein